jgi:RHS repeat-associated protein
VNGNLILDNNKQISSITYNYLNLPSVVTVAGKGTITYTYDAAGNKLKKVTVENPSVANGQITTTTTTMYIGGFIYESKTDTNPNTTDYTDKLQFGGHEEGRIRALYNTVGSPNTISGFAYDYMLKDHLGNVRMVLTDEIKQGSDLASMEDATAITEEAVFSNMGNTRVGKPAGYPVDTYTTPNEKVAKVTGSGQRIGPGVLLKVMAGDKFNFRVTSWYKTNGTTPAAPVTDFINDLVFMMSAHVGNTATKGTFAELQASDIFTPGAGSFLTSQNSYVSIRPKAFVSWVLFDEQLKIAKDASGSIIAGGYSGYEQVPAETVYNNGTANPNVYEHIRANLPVNKNGYLYIYVSNETPNIDVFFDNLQVTHIRGPILEETHYYPFGLTMAGISSRAANITPNKEQTFQGQRFDDELGLNWIQFKWRNHDPQIGRFIEIDPLAEDYVNNSTYAFSENKVTNHIELEGLEAVSAGNPVDWLNAALGQITEAVGRGIDKVISFFTKTEVEVSKPSQVTNASLVITTSSTTEYGTNFLGFIQHSKSSNATTSNGPSLFKAETKNEVKVELKQEVQVGNTKVGTKTAVDGSTQEVKTETQVSIKKVPVRVSFSYFQNFQTGETKTKARAGAGTSSNQAFGQVEISNKDGNTTTSLSLGLEEKNKNVKTTFSFGKIF